MRIKKILIAIVTFFVIFLLQNIRLFASNSYYLMSCTKQNIPTGYYSTVDTTVTEAEFRENLHAIISANYVMKSYTEAWTIDYYADADPYNEGHVKCLYTDQSVENGSHISSGSKLYWNREHTWPKSHGFADESVPAYTDCHHLRAAESAINIAKSDNDFGEIDSGYTESFGNRYGNNVFEPKDDVKGDVARMLLYMMIRYGEYDDTTISDTPLNLTLVDDVDTTSTSTGNGQLAKLSTILSWHYQDPVSDSEIYRNNVVYMYQKNRNPFIDHPEYVEYAFQGSGTYTDSSTSDTTVTPDEEVRTEEVLYDSCGFETDEGFTPATKATECYGQFTYNTNEISWSGYNAAPYTTEAITGEYSMRLTVKQNTINTAQFFMLEDVYNLSRITFNAKGGDSSLSLNIMYSLDNGISWDIGETITPTTSAKNYEYIFSSNGGYEEARIGFAFSNDSTKTTYINIDDLCIYRYKDTADKEFQREDTKASLKFNYTSETTTVTGSSYKLATSMDDIASGTDVVITALDYETYPYAIGTSKTNNYAQADVTIADGKISDLGDASIFTVGDGYSSGTYCLETSDGKYLGNGTANKALKPTQTLSDTTSWNISIDESTYSATITVADSSINYNTIQYNSASSLFSCYSSGQKEVAIWVKVDGTYDKTDYTYSNMGLRFGGVIEKELYDELLAIDSTASFGVALSRDGSDYTHYDCTPAIVSIVDGVSTLDEENGTYVQWATVITTPEAYYSTLVYAKVYVVLDETIYYMNESCYSVNTLAAYYSTNGTTLGLTEEQIGAVGGLTS